jgi:hypothetical protein
VCAVPFALLRGGLSIGALLADIGRGGAGRGLALLLLLLLLLMELDPLLDALVGHSLHGRVVGEDFDVLLGTGARVVAVRVA